MTADPPPEPGRAAAGPPSEPIDGSGSRCARCVLAPNPSPMTLDGTNTWLVAAPGSPSVIVVDPGPADAGHLRGYPPWPRGTGAGSSRSCSRTGTPTTRPAPGSWRS